MASFTFDRISLPGPLSFPPAAPFRAEGAVDPDAAEFLRRVGLAQRLAPAERAALCARVERRAFTAGEVLARAGEACGPALVIVRRGALAAARGEERARIEAGTLFGALGVLSGEPSDAALVALEDGEALVLAHDALANAPALRARLVEALAPRVAARARKASEARDASEAARREELARRREFAAFFALTVALFGVAQLVQTFIRRELPPALQMGFSWGFLVLLLAPVAWFVRRQPLALAQRGVTLTGARRALAEGLAVGGAIALACLALRAGAVLRGEPLLTWGSVANYSRVEFAVFLAAYAPHCLLQEFVARGVLQTSLERLLPDGGARAPVLATAAFFAVFHLYVSVGFALITFAVSVLLGALYARHRSLAGVTLAHALMGVASVAVGLN